MVTKLHIDFNQPLKQKDRLISFFTSRKTIASLIILLIIAMLALFYKTKSYAFIFLIPIIAFAGFSIINYAEPEKDNIEIKAAGFLVIDQPTVVEFMSPSCMACIYSRPTVSAMKELYSDKIKFITVNIKDSESMGLIKNIMLDQLLLL